MVLSSSSFHWDNWRSLLSYTQYQANDSNHIPFYLSMLWENTPPCHPDCSSTAPQIRKLASFQLYLQLFPTKQNWLQRGVGSRNARIWDTLALSQSAADIKKLTKLVFLVPLRPRSLGLRPWKKNWMKERFLFRHEMQGFKDGCELSTPSKT